MPNRIIKESICTSYDLSLLSAEEERLFWRLLVCADDFGCFHADNEILVGRCYPYHINKITIEDVNNWVNGLEKAGLISTYVDNNRRFLQITNFQKHQTRRATKRKYPQPPDNILTQLQTNDSSCKQMVEKNDNDNDNDNVFENVNENENDNGDVAAIYSSFENEIAALTPISSEKLGKWIDDLGSNAKDWITSAIGIAVDQNVRKYSYIEKILKDWHAKGYKDNGHGKPGNKPESKHGDGWA